MEDTAVNKSKNRILNYIENIPKTTINRIGIIVLLLLLIILDSKIGIISYIINKIEYRFYDLLEWISFIEINYSGSSGFLGSIIGAIIGLSGVLIGFLLAKKYEQKKEKRILSHSLINIYGKTHLLNLNTDMSFDSKISSIKLYIPYIYNKECKEYINYIEDYYIKEKVIDWIMMIENTPAEIVHAGALEEFNKYIKKAIKQLGYYKDLEKVLISNKQKHL